MGLKFPPHLLHCQTPLLIPTLTWIILAFIMLELHKQPSKYLLSYSLWVGCENLEKKAFIHLVSANPEHWNSLVIYPFTPPKVRSLHYDAHLNIMLISCHIYFNLQRYSMPWQKTKKYRQNHRIAHMEYCPRSHKRVFSNYCQER